jgi:predicted helicase
VGLLDYWRGQYTNNDLLAYKFEHEIHANEISILPYYIACLNIEQSYYELTNNWHEFNGACFVNTLDNWGFEQKHQGSNYDVFGGVTDENQARIQTQNARVIPIIMGNPPYNANQKNENDNNKNDKAQLADQRIKETYLAQSTAQKTKLYDPYIRFFRWASDRLSEQGIVAFITNRSYLDARQADGFRKSIANEFQQIFIIDLMSDVRKNPKLSGTKHNIFGIQTGVAIIFLVRNPKQETSTIHYLSLDDFMTAVEKRHWLQHNTLRQLIKSREFITIKPNAQGTWLNQAEESEQWNNYLPLASKDAKAGKAGANTIFKMYSLGVVTARDEWVYDIDESHLTSKINFLIDTYNKQSNAELDSTIKWSRAVKNDLRKKISYQFNEQLIVNSLYRPFIMKKLYFSQQLNEMQYKQKEIFGFKLTNRLVLTKINN